MKQSQLKAIREQLAAGTTFSALYLLLQMATNPYLDLADDYVANFCSFLLLVFFISTIIFKLGTLAELWAIVTPHLPNLDLLILSVRRRPRATAGGGWL